MKELSIKEKAKRYDEALERAQVFIGTNYHSSLAREMGEFIFPALKEGEDEKIRKELISLFKDGAKGVNHRYTGEDYERWIAWLEKQGEQKCTAEEVLIKAGLKPYKDGDQWCILLGDNIQEGICGFGDTIDDALYAFLNDLIKSQKEQKSAEWSEEDETTFKVIFEELEKYIMFKQYSTSLSVYDLQWLKSLRPHSQWKPSDEHYELEEFAKIVRGNLTGISKAVQKLFEAKYLQLTGNKMYGGFKD